MGSRSWEQPVRVCAHTREGKQLIPLRHTAEDFTGTLRLAIRGSLGSHRLLTSYLEMFRARASESRTQFLISLPSTQFFPVLP